jgi:hypothetical protein
LRALSNGDVLMDYFHNLLPAGAHLLQCQHAAVKAALHASDSPGTVGIVRNRFIASPPASLAVVASV